MLLAMCEGVTGGINLPIDLAGSVAVESAWWSWAAVGLHTALLLTLFCQTMILFDGKTVPRRLYTLSVLAAVVLPILFSGIRPAAIAMNGYESASVSGTYLGQLVSMIAGASAGIVIGWLYGKSWESHTGDHAKEANALLKDENNKGFEVPTAQTV